MTFLNKIKAFAANESGAVTVDWVVLTAAIVGLGLAVVTSVRSGVGFTVARMADHVALFAESSGRAVLCVAPDQLRAVLDVLEANGVPHSRIGVAGGDRLVVKDQFDVALEDAAAAHRDRLPEALGSGTTQG